MNILKPLNPEKSFPGFYSNPTIRMLGAKTRWTVVDSELTPIHLPQLLDHGNIRAVSELGAACMVTLPELTNRLPQAANCSRYLTTEDGIAAVIIDREAPAAASDQLRQMPTLYAEHSMNRRGQLFLIPTPGSYIDLPPLAGTATVQAHNGHIQIVLQGWVTFSRNVLPPGEANLVRSTGWSTSFWQDHLPAVELLIDHHKATAIATRSPLLSSLIEQITRTPLHVSLSDTRGDVAAYEHAALGEIHRRLTTLLQRVKHTEKPCHTGQTYLLYNAAVNLLYHRQNRGDDIEPVLFDAARDVITQQDLWKPPPKRRTRWPR